MRALPTTLGGLIFMMLGIGPAWAPGTISIDEVMDQLKDNDKLVGEIGAELKAQSLEAERVICIGARFGGHWVEIAGGRSVPYECEVGKKKLKIEGTVHLLDTKGKEIDMSDEKAPERAVDYKQTDLTWTWE